MERRRFLAATATAGLGSLLPLPLRAGQERTDLVLARGGSPAGLVRTAVEKLGGMGRFVQPGQTVFLKPNMSWDREPEYAATTNPEAAAEVVRLCYEAGAKRVVAADRTCNEARRCYIHSGLEEAMGDAGATVRFTRTPLFESHPIPGGRALEEWDFFVDALEADVLINLPVLKHHGMAKVSAGLKNSMGLIGGNRGRIHVRFDRKLADINRVLVADLTIVDAVRVLTRHGPQGGRREDVVRMDTVLAGVDPVLVDAWAVRLFGLEPSSMGWLAEAERSGLGSADTGAEAPLRVEAG